MLTTSRKQKFQNALRNYSKTYLNGRLKELDESGTRLMVNSFLTDVLGYIPIDEVKTEYMIRGTYADYVIQTKGERHFLVEVKALSLSLSEKHLRQTINYGANEGIEWALLTNGKNFELYKILFNKPIEWRKVFSFDLSNPAHIKDAIDLIQYLHKDSVLNKGLDRLWSKNCALEPGTIAGLLYTKQVISFIDKSLTSRYKSKFSAEEISAAITRLISTPVPLASIVKAPVLRERKKEVQAEAAIPQQAITVASST